VLFRSVDVINQTDFVENLNGEQKLGQPMVNFSYIQDWGILEAYVLTGFRERTFSGLKGRPGFPLEVDTDNPLYESSEEEKHIDWAIRYSHTFGLLDFGISHFQGTSHEPRLTPSFNESMELVKFRPFYDQMDQTGLELQTTIEGWLLKGELISRKTHDKRFTSFVTGFEYTLGDIAYSGIDVGLIAEYMFDDRTKIKELIVQGDEQFEQDLFPFTLFGGVCLSGASLPRG